MFDDNKEINPHGCGIGLTVSKKYIEKLGGSIWIESEYEKYTKVVFRIPHISKSINQQNDSDSNEEEGIFSSCINYEGWDDLNSVYNANDLIASKMKLYNLLYDIFIPQFYWEEVK